MTIRECIRLAAERHEWRVVNVFRVQGNPSLLIRAQDDPSVCPVVGAAFRQHSTDDRPPLPAQAARSLGLPWRKMTAIMRASDANEPRGTEPRARYGIIRRHLERELLKTEGRT